MRCCSAVTVLTAERSAELTILLAEIVLRKASSAAVPADLAALLAACARLAPLTAARTREVRAFLPPELRQFTDAQAGGGGSTRWCR